MRSVTVIEQSDIASVAVIAANSGAIFRAKRIATEFGLTWISREDSKSLSRYTYQLLVSADNLALIARDASHGPVAIDFTGGRNAHRRRFGGGRKQALARAVGVGKNNIHHVLDATAGYGGDAFVLASLGCRVILFERSAALAAMLTHAIDQARQDSTIAAIAQQMSVVHGDASLWLLDKHNIHVADTIYLDPMYPDSGKSALAKKNMQALHAIAGPDTDSEFLLHAALSAAGKRVVVKRPKGADSLAGRAADTSISSSKTRYDIYLVNL